MSLNKINIALLLGDPSGIGPELVSKLLNEDITNKANIIIIGEKKILENGNEISFPFSKIFFSPIIIMLALFVISSFNNFETNSGPMPEGSPSNNAILILLRDIFFFTVCIRLCLYY